MRVASACLIAACILAARKLAQYDGGKRVPATISAIEDGIRWAEEIMDQFGALEIDSRVEPALKLANPAR